MRGRPTTPESFWGRLAPPNERGCMLWTGCLREGYGALSVRQKMCSAHRYAWVLLNGPIPDGLWVLHHCDTRACANPAHLFLGTAADNNLDAAIKGRSASGPRNGQRVKPGRTPRGERIGIAKLTAAAVDTIRRRFARGERGRSIAADFGVNPSTVYRVCRLETWAHVPKGAVNG